MRVRWVPVVVAPALVLVVVACVPVFGGGRSGGGRSGCILCQFANFSKMGSAPTYAPTYAHTRIYAYTRNNF